MIGDEPDTRIVPQRPPTSLVDVHAESVNPAQPPTGETGSPRIHGGRTSAAVHVRQAARALGNWWLAMSLRALGVMILWFVGLYLLHIPLAPLWAVVGGLMTFVPHFGGVFSVVGPVFTVLVSGDDLARLAYVLGLYAVIVIADQLLLQPLLMKRVTRVPIWLSVVAPIVLGMLIPFWGILLAPPLLAVVYAFRTPKKEAP